MSKFKLTAPTILAYDVNLSLVLKKSKFKNFERVATFIHQLEFLISLRSKADIFKVMDGHRYTYMNYSEWALVFPHWSSCTIQRTITTAEETGIVISKLKNRGQQSRSKWYSINEEKLNSYMDGVAEVETYQVDESKNGAETYQVDIFGKHQVDIFAQATTVVSNTEVTEEEEEKNFSSQVSNLTAVNEVSSLPVTVNSTHLPYDTSVDVPQKIEAPLGTIVESGNDVKEIVAYAKKHLNNTEIITPSIKKDITARLKEGFTAEMFCICIDKKMVWKMPKSLGLLAQSGDRLTKILNAPDVRKEVQVIRIGKQRQIELDNESDFNRKYL